MSNASDALPDLEFRFTHPDDVGKYGDGWISYSERQIMLMPVRQLIQVEDTIDMSIVDMMNGSRNATSAGTLAATWLGLLLEDPAVAGEYASYEVHVHHIDWRAAVPKGPEVSGSETSGQEPSASGPSSSVVVLPT